MARTALIVDDSNSMRQMVAYALRGAGFEILQGANGQEGLDCLKTASGPKVDIIVTDLNMPIMDGLTFIKNVRLDPKYRFTPILMLTTESADSKKADGKAAGATGWIVKPFQPEQLIKVVQKVLP